MDGYIDIHSHVLPGFDDGSKTEEESVAIVEYADRQGFSRIVCTPHLMSGVYNNSSVEIERATGRLQEAVSSNGLRISLNWGAENYLDDAFVELLESDGAITYGAVGRYLLVEVPFLKIPDYLEEITFRIMLKRYRPIIAHPERYTDIIKKPRKIMGLVEAGYQVQVNLGSFGNLYGRSVQRTAEKIFDMGVVDYVASDIHSLGHVEQVYGDGLKRFVKVAGEREARRILVENPANLLGISTGVEGEA